MSSSRNSRRDFLRNLACVACSGSAAALFPQLRMIGTALANTSSLTGYKALVCVYLAGGNDSWNLLVPFDAARYGVYSSSRGGVYNAQSNSSGLALALPTGAQVATQKIVDAGDASSATNQYFMHEKAAKLAALYRSNKLALAVNVGTLVKPITMADYSTPANRPPQLFSHSDQENLWHQANTIASSSRGWGGRCGDVVHASNPNQDLSTCISIAGANRFEVGLSTVPYRMSSGGLTSLNGMCNPTPCSGVSATSVRDNALNALLDATYENDFAGEYSKVFGRGRDLYNLLKTGLDGTTLVTPFLTDSLSSQLQTVAKMIKLSKAQNFAARQIYYVRLGGFDLHAGLMSGGNSDHAALLTLVSEAVDAFWSAMGPDDVNARDEVTLFTASEFARTLQSNGSGSDHAWGGVQFALGGAVNGARLYSDGGGPIHGFPDQNLAAPNNFSRGQMIPGIGVDQYAATLAQWFGVTSPTDLAAIFPNLGHFGSSNLGFV